MYVPWWPRVWGCCSIPAGFLTFSVSSLYCHYLIKYPKTFAENRDLNYGAGWTLLLCKTLSCYGCAYSLCTETTLLWNMYSDYKMSLFKLMWNCKLGCFTSEASYLFLQTKDPAGPCTVFHYIISQSDECRGIFFHFLNKAQILAVKCQNMCMYALGVCMHVWVTCMDLQACAIITCWWECKSICKCNSTDWLSPSVIFITCRIQQNYAIPAHEDCVTLTSIFSCLSYHENNCELCISNYRHRHNNNSEQMALW